MTDTLAGLTRRIQGFAYDKETQQELSYMVEESGIRGLDAADAIVELALGEAGESWMYGAGIPAGQGAQVGADMAELREIDAGDDDEAEDGSADFGDGDDGDYDPLDGADDSTVYDMSGLVDPLMADDEDDDSLLGQLDDDEAGVDIAELDDELNELENDPLVGADGGGAGEDDAGMGDHEVSIY